MVVGGIFVEPLDWAVTGYSIYQDPLDPWNYAGLIPFVPAGAGKVGKAVANFVELADDAADAAKGVKGAGKVADACEVGAASKATSRIDRSAFAKERAAYWKAEAKANPAKYGADDLVRMKKGRAPKGPDGHPVELHHKDRTMDGGLEPMTRTEHRLGENFKKNHPE